MPKHDKRSLFRLHLLGVVMPLAMVVLMLFGTKAFAAFLDLRNDNGVIGYVGTDFQESFMAASILQGPAGYYPLEVRAVKFVLGRPTGYDSTVIVRAHLYSVDSNNRPALLLASSDAITVTFAPEKNTDEERALLRPIIAIPTPRPFAVVLEYKSGTEYHTPGLVTDTSQNIPSGKNFYSRDGGANWIEHYDYWRKQPPGLVGYNLLWAWIESGVIISEPSPTPTLPPVPTFTPMATATPFSSATPTATPTTTNTPSPTFTPTSVIHNTQIFLPNLSASRLRPPDQPTLLEIDNQDEDNNYEVHYLSGSEYLTYFLQEATETSFSSPTIFQINNATTYRAVNRPPGIYYYRVYAINIAGRSPMSQVQTVTVPPPTTLWVIDNQTGYPLFIAIDGGDLIEVPRDHFEWRIPSGIHQIHAQSHCGDNDLMIDFPPYAITSSYIFSCGPL